eukprot:1572582-Pleurochrysis_carterae.AAC.1
MQRVERECMQCAEREWMQRAKREWMQRVERECMQCSERECSVWNVRACILERAASVRPSVQTIEIAPVWWSTADYEKRQGAVTCKE